MHQEGTLAPIKGSADKVGNEAAFERGKRSTADAESSASKAIYTCPMHPEVQRNHPGECPKCGMTKRFWFGAALALPVLGLAMAPSRSSATRCALESKVVILGGKYENENTDI